MDLLSVADELLALVLQYLTLEDLKRVDLTCKKLYRVAETNHKDWYGPAVPYRNRDGSSWKKMALEQADAIKQRSGKSVDSAICELHDRWYLCPDDDLRHISQCVLLDLRQDVATTPSLALSEAVAAACMAQGRFTEAMSLYSNIVKESALSEQTWLTAARHYFKPDLVELLPPDPSPLTKLASLFGAVAARSLLAVQHLYQLGASLFDELNGESVANVATWVNDVAMLKYLHKQGVDVLCGGQNRLSLQTAVQYDCVEAAQFLLDIGAVPDDKCINDAVFHNHTRVLRCLLKHSPAFKGGTNSRGELILSPLYSTAFDHIERPEALEILVADLGINIHAKTNCDECFAHIAAAQGDLATIKVVARLGGDMAIHDACGLSPLEIAVSFSHNDLVDWLKQDSNLVTPSKDQKKAWALQVISSWRPILIRNASRLMETLELSNVKDMWIANGMDERLAAIWITVFSGHTQQQLVGSIGCAWEIAYQKYCAAAIEVSDQPSFPQCPGSTCQSTVHNIIGQSKVPKESTARICLAASSRLNACEVKALHEFYGSELGRRFFSSLKKAQSKMSMLFLEFRNEVQDRL